VEALRYAAIYKDPDALPVEPNLRDYDEARARVTWAQACERLDGLPAGRGLNTDHEAVDRHAAGPNADRVALESAGAPSS
jgi:acetyl-CoA synthetase